MRKSLVISGFVLLIAMACPAYASPYEGGYAPEAGRTYAGGPNSYGVDLDIGYCYNYLAAYGSWVNMDPYGYVWCPRHMGYRWRPYSEGHWVWTDDGWTWISDEDWGWIPFHYGRWGWDDDVGWFWVPGTVWGPAWVSWRYNEQYCGWAPLPPGVEFRAGIDFRSLSIDIPGRFWVFIEAPHFLDRDVRSRVLPFERNTTIISYTSAHNNIYVRDNRIINEGIGVDDVRRFTKRDVPRYSLRDAGQPGPARVSGREVQIYRPAFRSDPAAKPSTFLNKDNASRELAPAKVFEPRQQPPQPLQGKAEITRRQAEEKSLLQRTQSQELKEMQRRQSEEIKRVQNQAEKSKVKQDYQSRTSQLQKSHQAEKQQMAERHRRDAEQARAAKPAKQGKPPEQGTKKQEEKTRMARSPGHP